MGEEEDVAGLDDIDEDELADAVADDLDPEPEPEPEVR